jgi:hypothetical protein
LHEALVALVRQGLRERGRLRMRLQGDSMWPTVMPGTLVEVERVSPADIKLGDLVVWQDEGRLVAHRIVQRVRDGSGVRLVTKGDNASSQDCSIPPQMILGRVCRAFGEAGATKDFGSFRYRLVAASWVLRWNVRRPLDGMGRPLPASAKVTLKRWRDSLGYRLSKGLQAFLLRR